MYPYLYTLTRQIQTPALSLVSSLSLPSFSIYRKTASGSTMPVAVAAAAGAAAAVGVMAAGVVAGTTAVGRR